MTDRLNKIFELLPSCTVFADIGCDHGYMAKAMLESGKANRVIIADISAKCLKKAEELLKVEIDLGKAKSVVSNGFERVGECDLALIAGMGGEEISSILLEVKVLPNSLVLQPMKNPQKVRVTAVRLGYEIKRDFIFKSAGKYYDILLLNKGKDSLTQDEIEFGRTNIIELSADFVEFIKLKLNKLIEYSKRQGLSEESKTQMNLQVEKLKKYVKV